MRSLPTSMRSGSEIEASLEGPLGLTITKVVLVRFARATQLDHAAASARSSSWQSLFSHSGFRCQTRRASMAAARGKGPAPGLDPRRSTAALRPSHARGEQLYHEIWDLQDSDCRLRQLGQPHRPSIPCCIFTCYGLDGWGGRIRRGICVRWPSAIVPCGKVRSCTICCHSLRRTIAVDPNWAQFLMRRFESCRPSQAVRSLPANVGKHRSNGVARLLRWRYQSSAWPRRHWRDPTGDVWSLPGNV